MRTVQIGIIGDFSPANETHIATNQSFQHASQALGVGVDAVWLPTDQAHEYSKFGGLLGSPGSPYRSLEGALTGIQYARESGTPFLGTCGGFQHLIIEYARNVMGFTGAAHAESDPYASRLIITPLSCSLKGKTMDVAIMPGTQAARIFGAERSTEAFYCDFGLNPEYEEPLRKAGLKFSACDQNGEVRIVELPGHPFFIGTLFVPQANSRPGSPHPLVLELCRSSQR